MGPVTDFWPAFEGFERKIFLRPTKKLYTTFTRLTIVLSLGKNNPDHNFEDFHHDATTGYKV